MKQKLLFLLVIVLIFSINGAAAKGVTENIGTLVIKYDNRFNSGRDLRIQVQINFNISVFEIFIDRENDTIVVYSAQIDNWEIGDWVDTKVEHHLISESYEYQGRIVAKPQNRNFSVITHFFNFKVLDVLDLNETVAATALIGLLFLIPAMVDKDRKRIERKMWNNLSLKVYLRHYPKKLFTKKVGWGWFIANILLLVASGGIYLVSEL